MSAYITGGGMANKETYFLREFKKGDYMLWSVCSQCYNLFTVVIRDDTKIYKMISKTSTDCTLQKLEQGGDFYTGGANLRVELIFNDGNVDIRESIVSGGITDRRANTVGYTYSYCIEDAWDNDYNDAYINVVAWRKSC